MNVVATKSLLFQIYAGHTIIMLKKGMSLTQLWGEKLKDFNLDLDFYAFMNNC